MLNPRVSFSFLAPRNMVNTSTSAPRKAAVSGRTTMRLPIVWATVPALKIFLAGSQVFPPSVVRDRYTSPANARAFSNARWLGLPLGGDNSRSQTAYTNLESFGSAVIEFLSFRTLGL